MISEITLWNALVLYLVPIAALGAIWLLASVWVFGLSRFSEKSALRADLQHRINARRRTRSGRDAQLSFVYVASSLLGDSCVQATVLFRASNALSRGRLRPLASGLHAISRFVTHADISPRAEIGPGLYLAHGLATVIGKGTVIGKNAVIYQHVTTGGGPTIGDDVRLWAGAKVIGPVTIGDRSEVGANGVVVSDVPPDTIALGVPAERHLPKGLPS